MDIDSLFSIRQAINTVYLANEEKLVQDLLKQLTDYQPAVVTNHARSLLQQLRRNKTQQFQKPVKHSLIQAFLQEYQLNSDEGIVLMSIAEALLRIPDRDTQDRFLADRLCAADWHQHVQHSDSLIVNLVTDALVISGSFKLHQQQMVLNHRSNF